MTRSPVRLTLRNLARVQIAAGAGALLAVALLPVGIPWFRTPGADPAVLFLAAAPAAGVVGILAALFAVLAPSFDAFPRAVRLAVAVLSVVGSAAPTLGFLLGIAAGRPVMTFVALLGAASLVAGVGVRLQRSWAPAAEIVFGLLPGSGAAVLVFSMGGRMDQWPVLLIGLICVPFALLALFAGGTLEPSPDSGRSGVVGRPTWRPPRPEPKDGGGLVFACRGVVGLTFFGWILLLVALPNLHHAVGRGRQRRTMADLRAIATSVEGWAVDHNSYPNTRSLDELESMVAPTYIRQLPRVDGWGWPFEYLPVERPAKPSGASREGPAPSGPQAYVIRSPGSDGEFELEDPTAYPDRPVEGLERDLVFAPGGGSQWPVGTMGP